MMAAKTLVKNVQAVILIVIVLATLRESDGMSEDRPEMRNYPLTEVKKHIITTWNYPDNYLSYIDLMYNFETTPGNRIKLVFDDFDLESSDFCRNDYVSIIDGHEVSDPLLGKFCGSVKPPPTISRDTKMSMKFHSDSYITRKGFKAIVTTESSTRVIPGVEETERNLTQYCLRTMRHQTRSIYKWGRNATRIAVALFLNNRQFLVPGNQTGAEITYELSMQLLSKLAMKKEISTNDLALYINALTAACIDPKHFFGFNLVNDLRTRVNISNYTNPFFMLTLCTAKDTMTTSDVVKLQQHFQAHLRPLWTDTQAMVVMALSCISSRSDESLEENIVEKNILDEMVSELKRKQHRNGTIDNWRSTALVLQALIATRSFETDFDLDAAMKYILKELRRYYPSIQDLYYILPVFNSMSLADISLDHCKNPVETEEVKRKLKEIERIQVQVSVIFGNDADLYRTWKLNVPSNYSFFQVLEKIGTLEPAYKVQYSFSEGKPFVVALSKHQDNSQEGFFWFIYTKPVSSNENPKLLEQSPVDIKVKTGEELILWYKSGFWAKPQEDSLG